MTDASAPVATLKKNYVSFIENVAQSVGLMAPSGGMAALIPLVFATAGNGTWLLFLLVVIAYLPITYNLSVFASRTASVGGVYTYMELGLGRFWGMLGGWCYLICCIFSVACVMAIFPHYFQVLTGISSTLVLATIGFAIVPSLFAWWISYRDIRLSTDITLRLEILSVAMMLVLSAIFLIRHPHLDMAQFSLQDTTFDGMRLALVLAFFSITGFESSTMLGGESTKPLRSIPRSLIMAYVPVGLLYIFISYILVSCFQGKTPSLDKAQSPFHVLATSSGVIFFAPLMVTAFIISFFACAIACMNAGSRILYAMAREGQFAKTGAYVHPIYATPCGALAIVVGCAFVICLVLLACGIDAMDVYNYTGQIASFGYILTYILVSIGAPIFLRNRGEMKVRNLIMAAIAVVCFMLPLIGSVYPVPAGPERFLPYIFLACLILGTAYSWFLSRNDSHDIVTDEETA